MKNRTHPTADIIYKEISKEIPTLSKTTIGESLKDMLKRDKKDEEEHHDTFAGLLEGM